jgi:hypothetical protein
MKLPGKPGKSRVQRYLAGPLPYYMLREVGYTLMQAGAKAVYPFTITRTAHSDDQ